MNSAYLKAVDELSKLVLVGISKNISPDHKQTKCHRIPNLETSINVQLRREFGNAFSFWELILMRTGYQLYFVGKKWYKGIMGLSRSTNCS
jgi:hypothetical protein